MRRLAVDEVDALPEVQPVQQQVAFQHGAIDAVIDPRRLLQIQGVPVLERADLIFFRMVADNWPQRPIHISRTTVNNHIQHILGKLNAHTRLEAIRRAEHAGLI